MRPASTTKFVMIASRSLAEGSTESIDKVLELLDTVVQPCAEKSMRSLTA